MLIKITKPNIRKWITPRTRLIGNLGTFGTHR